ncbi:hypothetical protein [Arcobacter sp.]|uniref:hypothetical protein n=1 Tax=Arcobacter sp. TaxID=1872629 RepID=UPI003D0CFC55
MNNLKIKITDIDENLKIYILLFSILGYLAKGLFDIQFGLYLGIVLGLFLLSQVFNNLRVNRFVFIYSLISLLAYFLIIFNNTFDEGLFFLPIILSSLGISIAIIDTVFEYKKFHYNLSKIILYALFIYCVVFFILFEDMNYALKGSRNMISAYLLCLLPYYYMVRHINGDKVSIWIAFFTFLICLISVGTAGVILSFFFLYALLHIRYKYLTFFLLIIIFFVYSFELQNYFYSFLNKIDPEILSKILYRLDINNLYGPSIRGVILNNYISNLDLFSFFYGIKLENLHWNINGIDYYNPHNSYLLLHAKSGILVFVYLSIIGVTLYKLFKLNKVLFFLFLVIILRASSDTVSFAHGYFEWSIYLFFLYIFYYKNRVNSIKIGFSK